MADEREPLSSEEMLRRAREGHDAEPPMPSTGASPMPDQEPEPAQIPDPIALPPRETIRPADRNPSDRRTDFWMPVLIAALVGLVVTGLVTFLLRDGGGSDVDAFVAGIEEGLSDGMREMGFTEATITCVIDDVRASGAYDSLDGLRETDLATLVTISPAAPLSEYPAEFRPVAEATVNGMVACVDPAETTDLTSLPGESQGPGDDAALDRLWQGCAADGGEACDLLYLVSPVSSDYERFGSTCGDRNGPDDGLCLELNGEGRRFEVWRAACGAGDFGACDLLYQLSPADSDDERFGTTCGGREDESPLSCWARLGPGTG